MNPKQYVLDANALVRFFKNEDGAVRVSELFRQADGGAIEISMSVVNLTEVFYVTARTTSVAHVKRLIGQAGLMVHFIASGVAASLAAGEIRLQYKLGLADSFAAALALERNATLVTADPEFAKLGKQLKILALPRHKA
jgi:ribonuclease VapC